MSAIFFDREMIHYEVMGRGKPVLFLHGWVGSWRYWIPAMQSISTSFRTYAVDMWGFGDTSKKQEYYSIKQQMNLLFHFQKQMGLGKLAVVGHGLGAVIGLLYARNFPESVDRIMMVSYPFSMSGVNSRMRQSAPGELIDWLLGKTIADEPIRIDAAKCDPESIRISLSDLSQFDLRKLYTQYDRLGLMLYGSEDPVIEPPNHSDLPEFSEKINMLVFENCSHFLMLEESSKFNRLLFDFLSLDQDHSPHYLQLKEEWKRRVR